MTAPSSPVRHGVVVVHGQGSQVAGDFLASVVNPIADELENAGATVIRHFTLGEPRARATLDVTHPPAGANQRHIFVFDEAYWADALVPPNATQVALWILKRGPRRIAGMVRNWLKDPANDAPEPRPPVASPALDRFAAMSRLARGLTGVSEPDPVEVPAPAILKLLYRVQLLFVAAVLFLVRVLTVPFAILIYVLYRLGGTRGEGPFKWVTKAAEALASLNPFFRDVLGDTYTFIEDGLWSSAMRARVEAPVAAFYADPAVADITVIAHSEGCAVTYDALAEGNAVGAAAGLVEGGKRLSLVTLGSAINRNFEFAEDAKRSPYAGRLAHTPLDHRITGTPPAPVPFQPTGDWAEVQRLRRRFYWVDLYARMDYVPAGGLVEGALRNSRVDPCQLKLRQVINEDALVNDHGAYFRNTDLVVPRLVRAMYGGEYPWPGATRRQSPALTHDRVHHRTGIVLRLDLVRLLVLTIVAAVFAMLFWWGGFQDGVLVGASWATSAGGDTEVTNKLTVPIVSAFILLAARPLYGALRDLICSDL